MKYIFKQIDDISGNFAETTVEFSADTLTDVLQQFEMFVRGCGFFPPKGVLDYVDDFDTELDEELDDIEEYNTSGYKAFDMMATSLMNSNHTDTITQQLGKCSVCGLQESVMKIHKCWDPKCPIQSNRTHAN
jgi:hypothetical protein